MRQLAREQGRLGRLHQLKIADGARERAGADERLERQSGDRLGASAPAYMNISSCSPDVAGCRRVEGSSVAAARADEDHFLRHLGMSGWGL